MKKLVLVLIAVLAIAQTTMAQSWKEASNFHHFMSNTFHPAEDGNYKPLREKADSLYFSAVAWQLSAIPSNYKEKETKETLIKLVAETKGIAEAVKANKPDDELLKLITQAHDTFHKIVGECKKTE